MALNPAYVERFHPVLPRVPDRLARLMTVVPDLLRLTPERAAGVTANHLGGPPEPAVHRHLAPGLRHGFLNLPAELPTVAEVSQLVADAVAAPDPVTA